MYYKKKLRIPEQKSSNKTIHILNALPIRLKKKSSKADFSDLVAHFGKNLILELTFW